MIAKLASEIEEEITQMIYETYETTTTRLTSEELAWASVNISLTSQEKYRSLLQASVLENVYLTVKCV